MFEVDTASRLARSHLTELAHYLIYPERHAEDFQRDEQCPPQLRILKQPGHGGVVSFAVVTRCITHVTFICHARIGYEY